MHKTGVMTVGVRTEILVPLADALAADGWRLAVAMAPPSPTPPPAGVVQLAHRSVHHLGEPTWFADLPSALSDRLLAEVMPVFRRHFVRHFDHRHAADSTWMDANNHFHRHLHRWWGLLRAHEIGAVVFSNVPHEGGAIVLYQLARALGLCTLVCLQSHVPGCFWASDTIDRLDRPPMVGNARATIPIDARPKSPFYMAGSVQRPTRWAYRRQAWARHARTAGLGLAGAWAWNPRAWRKSQLKAKELAQRHRQHYLPKELYGHFDPDQPYVYVPLHLQPEMTTDTLGGAYADQALLVETLRRALPDEIEIFAKENPKQSAYMREESFHARLQQIPGLRYIDISVPSLLLITHARVVATVTGTAGWEALQLGKPVLCFGIAWYRQLPGVHDAASDPQSAIAAALASTPDETALRAAVAARQADLWAGVLDMLYAELLPDFDVVANAATTAASLAQALAAITAAAPAAEPGP